MFGEFLWVFGLNRFPIEIFPSKDIILLLSLISWLFWILLIFIAVFRYEEEGNPVDDKFLYLASLFSRAILLSISCVFIFRKILESNFERMSSLLNRSSIILRLSVALNILILLLFIKCRFVSVASIFHFLLHSI